MDEIWKSIPESGSSHEVSNFGRVRHAVNLHIRKLATNRKGYLLARLYNPATKRRKNYSIARLVYAAFVGPIPPGMTVNHKDGVKSNNHIDNLELMTSIENTQHAKYVLGHKSGVTGNRHGRRKLSEEDIPRIHTMLAQGMPLRDIADHFGLQSIRSIADIARGKLWTHIPHTLDPAVLKQQRMKRILRGTSRPTSRLTDLDIPIIRAMKAAGTSYTQIAKHFGVSVFTIYAVVTRRTWTHIP